MKRKKKKIICTILMLIFLAIAIFSIWQIVIYNNNSKQEEEDFDELRELITQTSPSPSVFSEPPTISSVQPTNNTDSPEPPEQQDTETNPTPDTNTNTNTQNPKTQKTTSTPKPSEPVTLDALKEKNSDFLGWINVPGTKIDYPVMHTPGNPDYYLRKNFNKKYSSSGTPYMEEEASLDPMSDIVTIYGHHMSSGKMFADLEKFRKQDFLTKHNKIIFETLDNKYTYEIQYVFKTAVYLNTEEEFKYWSYINFADENDFNAFMDRVKASQLYDNGGSIAFGDKIIMLSTCEYTLKNGRLVVVGKLVDNIDKHPEPEPTPTPEPSSQPTSEQTPEPTSPPELTPIPEPTPEITPEPEPEKNWLTLNKLRELSLKGNELTWNDFEIYEHQDVGSGLYIWAFGIDETYGLMVGGPSLSEPPAYINIVLKSDMRIGVDIRTNNIDTFIQENNTKTEAAP